MMNTSVSSFPSTLARSLFSGARQVVAWSFSRFMTAPLQNLAMGVMGFAIVFSASNALFWQTSEHPAPLFATSKNVATDMRNSGEILRELVPPHPLELAVSRASNTHVNSQETQIPAPVSPIISSPDSLDSVSNEMLSSAQEVLKSMGLFSGKIDGFYGPLTAQAIRAFETKNGFTPKGALTSSIINKIISSPLGVVLPIAPVAQVEETAVPQVAFAATPTPVVQQVMPQATPQPDILTQISNNVSQASPATQSELVAVPVNPQVDKVLIERIQLGLANLGFYHSSLDGIAGESTARAIREFENFLSFEMTGLVNTQVLQWLEEAGAYS